MKSKGWNGTSKMQITRMFENSPFVVANRAQVIKILIDAANVLFGINADGISKELTDAVFQAISDRFVGIRINDIQEAFRDAQIEKKPYVSISRDELIEPIFSYWRKKQFILSAIKDIESVEIENQDAILKAERFKAEAMDTFNLSVHNKKWSGNPFQAFIIAPDIANSIDPRIKKVLWKASVREFDKNKTQTFFDLDNPLNENRIYSQKIMIYYCKNK